PPSYAHLILLTDRPGELLATISSRCQDVRFDALPEGELAVRLEREGATPDTALACARLSLGDGHRARALAAAEGQSLRRAAEKLAGSALAGQLDDRPWVELLDLSKAAGDRVAAELSDAGAAALELVDDTRSRMALNVTEELALETLAYRIAALARDATRSIGPSRGSRP